VTNVVPIGTKRRRYTKREKATVVIAAEMSTAAAAAEASGIPETNIRRWRDDPALAEYSAKTREDMADGFRVILGRVIDHIAEIIPKMEPKDAIVLAGVAAEKLLLLTGEATERIETRLIPKDFADGEADAIAAWLRDLARERMATEG
jgi:hypothetical protein